MQWQEFRSHIRHLPAKDAARIERAFVLGKTVHADQKRKSGEPYFSHPVAVARMLADMGADADTLIAALLHDAVEDTPTTLVEIDRLFDGSVAALIDGVTKLDVGDLGNKPKLNEQMESLRKIFTLMQQDVRIMVIKLVDRLHNMQTIEFLSPSRQQGLARETLDVYVKIADRLCMQDLRDELEALCIAVLEPQQYGRPTEMRSANEQRGIATINHMRDQIRSRDKILASRVQVSFEFKTWDQLKSQLETDGSVATGLSMITAAFICDDIDGCYRALGILHQLWKREVLSFQDFINAPQINGYQGLHTTVIVQDGTRVRCKIRTREMQEYARKGIVKNCFDSKALGIAEYLPWTQRISSLTSDTEGSSNDFWESLQSDILGESIIIHGPDDTTVQLPRNSTALDGAFYLLQDEALQTESIKMNGIVVPFGKPLSNATSLHITLTDKASWSRDWLRQVNTGFAAAKIRAALAQQSAEEKYVIGREMLQQTLTEQKRGYVEEFEKQTLLPQLQEFGFQSLDDVYASIADGRLEPEEAYHAFFRRKRRDDHHAKPPAVVVRYEADMASMEMMDRLNVIHRMYGSHLTDIRYRRISETRTNVTLHMRIHSQHLKVFVESLKAAGADRISTDVQSDVWSIAITAILVMLWGMDAVLTKFILDTGITPSTFTFIRSWSGVAVAVLAFLFVSERRALLRIPLSHPMLWISGISFFFVNLLTNYTLSQVSPFFYKTSLRISAPLLALPVLIRRRADWRSVLCVGLIAVGFFFLTRQAENAGSLLLTIAMACMFVIYTKASERFQSDAHIGLRYPQFFPMISIIAALVSPVLYLFDPVIWPDPSLTATVAAFTAGFVCIPYILFYQLHRTMGYARLSPFFHLSIAITFVAQWLIFGTFDGWLLIPCAAFITASTMMPNASKAEFA